MTTTTHRNGRIKAREGFCLCGHRVVGANQREVRDLLKAHIALAKGKALPIAKSTAPVDVLVCTICGQEPTPAQRKRLDAGDAVGHKVDGWASHKIRLMSRDERTYGPRVPTNVEGATPHRIRGEHCECCGSTSYEDLHTGDQGYTACCNEPTAWSCDDGHCYHN